MATCLKGINSQSNSSFEKMTKKFQAVHGFFKHTRLFSQRKFFSKTSETLSKINIVVQTRTNVKLIHFHVATEQGYAGTLLTKDSIVHAFLDTPSHTIGRLELLDVKILMNAKKQAMFAQVPSKNA